MHANHFFFIEAYPDCTAAASALIGIHLLLCAEHQRKKNKKKKSFFHISTLQFIIGSKSLIRTAEETSQVWVKLKV